MTLAKEAGGWKSTLRTHTFIMHVFMLLCVLGFLGATVCVNQVEYEENYADSYDNEISQDQQMGECSFLNFVVKFEHLKHYCNHFHVLPFTTFFKQRLFCLIH